MGHSVAIIDKAIFPRHKTCASWINALAFTRFPYLQPELHNLVDSPFHGIRFYDQSISRHGSYKERRPSGYLTLRSKFDHGLAKVAVAAGATLYQGNPGHANRGPRLGMHPAVLLVAFLGSLVVFGPPGIVLGPVTITIAAVLWEIWTLRLKPA
jgi:hypothetical protein